MKVYSTYRQRGGFNWVSALLLLVFVAAIVAGIALGPKYYANFNLRQKAWSLMVRASELNDTQIREQILAEVKERNIPLSADQLHVYREGKDKIIVTYEYEWPVGLPGLDDVNLPFKETLEREVTEIKKL
ncbi:MAG TPA: hypothetical protein PKW95_17870 [bacterium]|nr:hypothetical protein [bacterium]